jgi:hypothetical protein
MKGQIKLASFNVNVFHHEFMPCPVKINTINSAASVADGRHIQINTHKVHHKRSLKLLSRLTKTLNNFGVYFVAQ